MTLFIFSILLFALFSECHCQIQFKFDIDVNHIYKDELEANDIFGYSVLHSHESDKYGVFNLQNFNAQKIPVNEVEVKLLSNNFGVNSYNNIGRLYDKNFYLNWSITKDHNSDHHFLGINMIKLSVSGQNLKSYRSNFKIKNEVFIQDYSQNNICITPASLYHAITASGQFTIKGLVRTDKDFNLEKHRFFSINNNPFSINEITYRNNNLYVTLNKLSNIQTGVSLSYILKLDQDFNLLKAVEIIDFHNYKTDFTLNGDLILKGKSDLTQNYRYLIIDEELNYLKEYTHITPYYHFQYISPKSGLSYHPFVNSKGDIFLTTHFNNSTLQTKLDQNYNVVWEKIMPGYAEFYPDANGGGYFNSRLSSLATDYNKIFKINNLGHSVPELFDYCGRGFDNTDFYKNKVLPYTEVTFIDTAQLVEILPADYVTLIDTLEVENINLQFKKPSASFDISDLCINSCDTIQVEQPNINDTATYTINGISSSNVFCPSEAGVYTIQKNIVFFGGCVDSFMKMVHVYPPPVYSLTDSFILCDNFTPLDIEVSTQAENTVFWSELKSNEYNVSVSLPGIYHLEISNGYCSITDSITIRNISELYSEWPELIESETISICPDETYTIESNNSFPGVITWSDGSGNSQFLADSPGVYSVTGNLHNCTLKDSIIVLDKNCEISRVFVPNVFSPNNDNINDVLAISFSNAEIKEFSVFNRWGALMYSTSNYSDGWDGSFKGKEMPPGVYVYFVRYKDLHSGKESILKGNSTLIK